MIDQALANLHKCVWFGLFEELDRSIEMFEYQTGLKIKMKHLNKNVKYPKPTTDDVLRIKQLIPLDLYLYEYGKQLFEWRWQIYKNGSLPRSNILLPQIIHGCTSTNSYIACQQLQL